jgi:transposase
VGEHPVETQLQGTNMLQPLSVPCAQFGRTVFKEIKQCRRIATRYDKLAINYIAFIKVASIRVWLRAYESTP